MKRFVVVVVEILHVKKQEGRGKKSRGGEVERERERERETDRQTDRQTERERDRQTDRQTDRPYLLGERI